MSEVRVRFAPSPTGFLHIGGARTALFNWLYARAKGGKFLLRIEDTDRERSESRFTDDILEAHHWLGFDYDEEPVFQSARFDVYKKIGDELIAKKLAYRCECTQAELDAVRAQCEKEKRAFRYPGTCREKTSVKSPSVVRVIVPKTGETGFEDLIRGQITFQNKDIDDWVIQRADGSPTYNFSVVVDDNFQRISHILRGDDHINNTPKQILLYQTLGYQVPRFAHLPMILGQDKTKLSKRHGAASTLEYRKMGYLPEAIINFLVRLGWSYGDKEYFTIDELKSVFDITRVGKANAVFNTEKLVWVSGLVMKDMTNEHHLNYLKKYFGEEIAFTKGQSDEKLKAGIEIVKAKVKNVHEMIDQLKCLFGEDPTHDFSALKPADLPKVKENLELMAPILSASTFEKAEMESKARAEAEKTGQKLAPIAQALRFAVTGGKISPGLFEMLEVQGKETVLRRIQTCLAAFPKA